MFQRHKGPKELYTTVKEEKIRGRERFWSGSRRAAAVAAAAAASANVGTVGLSPILGCSAGGGRPDAIEETVEARVVVDPPARFKWLRLEAPAPAEFAAAIVGE